MQSHQISIPVEVSRKEYFDDEIKPVEVFVGEDFVWSLPALKEGVLDDIKSIEVTFGASRNFLRFNKLRFEFSTTGAQLTEEYTGLYRLNISITSQKGQKTVYIQYMTVLSHNEEEK